MEKVKAEDIIKATRILEEANKFADFCLMISEQKKLNQLLGDEEKLITLEKKWVKDQEN